MPDSCERCGSDDRVWLTGTGRHHWRLCARCRLSFRRWFVMTLPRVLRRFGPYRRSR